MKLTRVILLLLVGVFLAQAVFYFPVLPETISTHFDELGRPNGLAGKTVFFALEAVLLAVLVGEALLVPSVLARMPDSRLRIPNRGYWLEGERRSLLFARISSHFEALGVVLMVFFIAANQLLFRANLARENLPAGLTLALVAVFFVCILFWLIRFPRLFRVD